jgi:hypothetical protein
MAYIHLTEQAGQATTVVIIPITQHQQIHSVDAGALQIWQDHC